MPPINTYTAKSSWSSTTSATDTSLDTSLSDYFIYSSYDRDRFKKEREVREKKLEEDLKNPAVKAIIDNYLNDDRIMWFVDEENKEAYLKYSNLLNEYYGIGSYVYDPVNDEFRGFGNNTPDPQGWIECVIVDCLEYHKDYAVKANIVRFGLTCLRTDTESRLTVIIEKSCGLSKDEAEELLYFAKAKSVWVPSKFKNIESKICLAAR